MATGTIKTGTAEIAYLTSVTAGVETYGRVIKDPNTGTCRIYVIARSTSDMGSSTILAKIPSGYRPKTTEALYGTIVVGGNTTSSYYGTLGTDGNLYQGLSASARACFFVGEYAV